MDGLLRYFRTGMSMVLRFSPLLAAMSNNKGVEALYQHVYIFDK